MYLLFYAWLCSITLLMHAQPITIIVDPAGNLHDCGRTVEQPTGHDSGSYDERAQMFQCAQALKQELEKNKQIKVIFSRFPGEQTQQHTKAELANQLRADLYIRLQAYHHAHTKVEISIFYYDEYRPLVPYSITDIIPYRDAYMHAYALSKTYADALQDLLQAPAYKRYINAIHVHAAPVTSLCGIRQPALCIEMGLNHATDWHFICTPLANALQKIIL